MAKQLWFRDTTETVLMIDRTVMRARAGLLILIPIFIAFSIFYFNSSLTTTWIVDDATAISNLPEMDAENKQIYTIKAVKKTYDYTLETIVLLYALFDFLCGMSVWSAKFSPSILFAYFITRNKKSQYTVYSPKRFAWGMGIILIFICLLFFNPNIIPFVGEVIIPLGVAITLLSMCFVFMWMELAFGYCFGCTIYAWLVKAGVFKDECIDCNDITQN